MNTPVPLKRVVRINPETLPEDTAPSFEFQYVDIGSVGRGRLVEEPPTLAFVDAPSRARRILRPGDTIVSTVRTYLRAAVPIERPGLIGSTGFACLRPRRGVDAGFLGWWAQSDGLIEDVVARSVGVSYPAINPSELGLIRFPMRPIAEQRAIADHLDTETARIDALIEKKQRLIDAVEERWRRELLSALGLSDTPRPSPSPWLSQPLADGWTVMPLRRLLESVWGGDWGSEPGNLERDLPCVRAADFNFAHLAAVKGAPRSFDRNTLRSRLLINGDLVLEKSGGGEGVPVGRVVAWKGEGQAVPTNFAGGMRPANDTDATFALLAFRAAYEVGLPWRSIKQTTGLQNLDVKHYLGHAWPVPPPAEQRSLAVRLKVRLDEMRSLQERLDRQVELLNEHRQALITAAVTGELEVPGVAA